MRRKRLDYRPGSSRRAAIPGIDRKRPAASHTDRGHGLPIQIDLGFGDVITPAPVETEIPSLLDLPNAKLLTYPRETVVAEKFEAMVSLGLANSRMKDFYDVRSLSRGFSC